MDLSMRVGRKVNVNLTMKKLCKSEAFGKVVGKFPPTISAITFTW